MKKINILQEIKTTHATEIGKLPDRKLAQIVRAVCASISSHLASGEGKVIIAGLGSFIIKQKEVEKAGVKKTVRRVTFLARKPKVKGEKKKKTE